MRELELDPVSILLVGGIVTVVIGAIVIIFIRVPQMQERRMAIERRIDENGRRRAEECHQSPGCEPGTQRDIALPTETAEAVPTSK